MFQCHIDVSFPLAFADTPTKMPTYLTVAKYEYDPGLQVGEEVQVGDWEIGWHKGDEPFRCLAFVQKRHKEIIPAKDGQPDIFRLSILLEVSDKEDLPRICEIFRRFNPGKFAEAE